MTEKREDTKSDQIRAWTVTVGNKPRVGQIETRVFTGHGHFLEGDDFFIDLKITFFGFLEVFASDH